MAHPGHMTQLKNEISEQDTMSDWFEEILPCPGNDKMRKKLNTSWQNFVSVLEHYQYYQMLWYCV